MADPQYDLMTTEQLEAEQTRLHGEAKQLKGRRRAVAVELDRRRVKEEALRKLAAMSDPERAALAQLLGPKGIASGEAHGIAQRAAQ